MWILFIHDLSFTLWSWYLFLLCTDSLSCCSMRFGLIHWLSAADETYRGRFSLSFHVTFWSLDQKPLRKHWFSFALTPYPDLTTPDDHEWNSSNASVQIRRAPSVWVCVNLKIMKIAACSIFVTAWMKHIKYWGAAGRNDGVLALTVPRKCLLSSHMILDLLHLTEINTQQRGQMMHNPGEMWSNTFTFDGRIFRTMLRVSSGCSKTLKMRQNLITYRCVLQHWGNTEVTSISNLCPREKGIMGDWRSVHLLSKPGFWKH